MFGRHMKLVVSLIDVRIEEQLHLQTMGGIAFVR